MSASDRFEPAQPAELPRPVVHGSASRQGARSARNEDVFACLAEGRVIVLADGMAERPGGAMASGIALREAKACVGASALTSSRVYELDGFAAARWINDVFRSARSALLAARADAGTSGLPMDTSLLVALIAARQVVIGHAGHTRCYRWRGGQLHQLTADHRHYPCGTAEPSIVGAGLGTLARVPLRGLGDPSGEDVEITTAPVEPGDYLLCCSNGVSDALPATSLASAFERERAPQTTVDQLIERVGAVDAEDDATAIVIRIDDPR